MAKTESSMVALNTVAPSFALMDIRSQRMTSLEQEKGSVATIIAFICNHCPYVKHIHQELPRLVKDFSAKGVTLIAINSNDIEQYPDDSPDNMHKTAQELDYCFPYLFDETQEVATAYQARCTPDFFVFDHNLHLVYRGQLDDSRPGNQVPVTGASIRQALQSLLEKRPVSTAQKPSLGCNIKWKV